MRGTIGTGLKALSGLSALLAVRFFSGALLGSQSNFSSPARMFHAPACLASWGEQQRGFRPLAEPLSSVARVISYACSPVASVWVGVV